MELSLIAVSKTAKSTISRLLIDLQFECFILEDVDRFLKQSMPLEEIAAKKVHGKTAIPEGRYEVIITMSNRFKRRLPLLVNVPGFEGIRIHPGNTAADTEGCLLPGTGRGLDTVTSSRTAFDGLFRKIDEALKTEKVFITIKR